MESYVRWGFTSLIRRGNFGGMGRPLQSIGTWLSAISCAEMAARMDLSFGLWTRVGQRKHEFNRSRHVAPVWQFRSYSPDGANVPEISLPCAVQKRLNRSICRLGCGLGWTKRSTSSIIFARWWQCAHMGGHIGATWRIRLNRPSAAAMRSCQITLTMHLLGLGYCRRSVIGNNVLASWPNSEISTNSYQALLLGSSNLGIYNSSSSSSSGEIFRVA